MHTIIPLGIETVAEIQQNIPLSAGKLAQLTCFLHVLQKVWTSQDEWL